MSGTWNSLTTEPGFDADTMLLLTDGSVLCKEFLSPNWHRLFPDESGSYTTGFWSSVAAMPDNPRILPADAGPTYAPFGFASAVLNNGNVFVAGGRTTSTRGWANRAQRPNS